MLMQCALSISFRSWSADISAASLSLLRAFIAAGTSCAIPSFDGNVEFYLGLSLSFLIGADLSPQPNASEALTPLADILV